MSVNLVRNKKTLVLGASMNPERYSNIAIGELRNHGHEVFAIGRDQGSVEGVEIAQAQVSLSGIDTVTLYLNPERQRDYYEYVLGLKPKRIVFNPGTENDEFEAMATKQGIEALVACTLVLLATGQY